MNNNPRIKQYSKASIRLACLSDAQLKQALEGTQSMHEGIGGKSCLFNIEEIPMFVKKIPLTDFEQLPQNFMSTANFFNLPLSYQYGIGSAGFGAWRELATHIMTTNWVITGEEDNFPIMYHWRILPSSPTNINLSYWGGIEQYCQYWENSSTIRKRVESLNKATTYIALFLEYVPQNLHDWLSAQMAISSEVAEAAVIFVAKQLMATNTFINSQGLMHFDAHFENILTDGERLYFSDFGLALSSKFDLSTAEKSFLKHHQSYDQACAAVNLLHCIITSLFGKHQWEAHLREYLGGKLGNVPPGIATIIKQYAPIALAMDRFYQQLQKASKSTAYPAIQLEKLLKKSLCLENPMH